MSKAILLFPNQLFEEALESPAEHLIIAKHWLFYHQLPFHVQKLMLHDASIESFASRARATGKKVSILEPNQCRDQSTFEQSLLQLASDFTIYDVVDDYLYRSLSAALGSNFVVLDSPSFLCNRVELQAFRSGAGNSKIRMAEFYKWQRRRMKLLIEPGGQPTGGRWSFDEHNRQRLPKDHQPAPPWQPHYSESEIQSLSDSAIRYQDHPGSSADFRWPINRDQALDLLDHFFTHRFAKFGPYEDAMDSSDSVVFHSQLSAPLNCGLLTPHEVVERAIEYAQSHPEVSLASLEGFIRQIIGWREYIRATYIWFGRTMRTKNHLHHTSDFPQGFWEAKSGLLPLDIVLQRVHKTAYCHHIERLMVAGCLLLLAEIHPDKAYEWFMSQFIDAYDWVMVPNVYAMSQFADGGLITTKPYLCGSAYIRKMSNFPVGSWTEIWDGLYWRFVDRHRELFSQNPRLQMTVRSLDKMTPDRKERILKSAEDWLAGSRETQQQSLEL